MRWTQVEELAALGASRRVAYAAAQPFPHAVFDEFFDPVMLSTVAEEFPDLSRDPRSKGYDDPNQIKFASKGTEQFPALTSQLMAYLNSAPFLDFLGTLTGIDGLLADPTFEGGGLHEIRRGGFLKVHADFDRHRATGQLRRLNALIYLNRDWEEAYGGQLELWDRDMRRCVQKISPVFNRMVVFTTDDYSYHGHPDPLSCPKDRCRRSLALYYYTPALTRADDSRGTSSAAGHSTLFRDRPGTDDAVRAYSPRLRTRLKRALRKVRAMLPG